MTEPCTCTDIVIYNELLGNRHVHYAQSDGVVVRLGCGRPVPIDVPETDVFEDVARLIRVLDSIGAEDA